MENTIKNNDTPASPLHLTLSPQSTVNEKMVRELESFLEFVEPARLSKSLRDMFLSYVYREHPLAPENLQEIADDLYFLFHFLDSVEEGK